MDQSRNRIVIAWSSNMNMLIGKLRQSLCELSGHRSRHRRIDLDIDLDIDRDTLESTVTALCSKARAGLANARNEEVLPHVVDVILGRLM